VQESQQQRGKEIPVQLLEVKQRKWLDPEKGEKREMWGQKLLEIT